MTSTIDGILWEADADTLVFSRVEGSLFDILGFEPEEWLGTPDFWQSRLHPDDAEWVIEACTEASKKRLPHRLTYRMIKADGEAIWLQDNVKVRIYGANAILSGIMIDVTELVEQRIELARLNSLNDHFRALYDLVPVAIWEEDWSGVLDELRILQNKSVQDIHMYAHQNPSFVDSLLSKLNVLSVNAEAVEMFGAVSADELMHRATEVFLADAPNSVFLTALDAILKGEREIEGVNTLKRLTGEVLHVLFRVSLPSLHAQNPRVVICEMDISAAHIANERFRLAAHVAGIGILDCRPKTQLYNWSSELHGFLGLKQDHPMSLEVLRDTIYPADRDKLEQFAAFLVAVDGETSLTKKIRFQRVDTNETCWLALDAWKIRSPHIPDPRILAVFRDVTSEEVARQDLLYTATHDALTGLANREFFISTLNETLLRSAIDGVRIGLLVLDVDHLKVINDTHGHDVGDELLRSFSRKLVQAIDNAFFIARLGGDEFAILIPDAQQSKLYEIAQKIRAQFIHPVSIGEVSFLCKPSIGACYVSETCNTAKELMKAADLALYAAKHTQRGSYALFNKNMFEVIDKKHRAIETARRALEQNQVQPFYQPKIDLRTGEIVGLEALMRWRSETGKYLSPSESPFALEDPQISIAVFDRMFETIIQDLKRWHSYGFDNINTALNIGEAELRDYSFADSFLEKLKDAQVPTSSIQVEIVESVFLGHGAELVATAIEHLNTAGVIIALDDFGTGYASLSHLQQYPVDILKIDKSFIHGMGSGRGNRPIVNAIVQLGKNFNLDVVAEGVETQQQIEYLRDFGCDYAQGFLFYRPMPAEDITNILLKQSAASVVAPLSK